MLTATPASVEARSSTARVVGWRQFLLLAALTAFTGSVVGLERPILPLIGAREFGLGSHAAILTFLVAFGTAKALANLGAGRLADRYGRRRVLLAGWLVGLPEPLLVAFAPSWEWVVAAHVLLGIQQGLCWTTLLSMMVDRARGKDRGFATGVNELAGYVGVAVAAFAAGYLAARYGLRPLPLLPSFAFVLVGLATTLLAVTETKRGDGDFPLAPPLDVAVQPLRVLRDVPLAAASQAGLVANLTDAVLWGLLPLHLARQGLQVEEIGVVAGTYPLVWGLGQGLSGPLSDRVGRRGPIAIGMAGQALAALALLVVQGFAAWLAAAAALGAFRALAYPTLLAAAVDSARDGRRATALGVYRFYRDLGFVIGGLLGGALADAFGIPAAIALAAALGLVAASIVLRFLPVSAAPSSGADVAVQPAVARGVDPRQRRTEE